MYPSSVIMNAIPASVVEVPEICLATPPQPDGGICPEVLMAARVAGVHRVFRMGGSHAIAAFAYGTESVPQVDKIVGPGNVWVATAKRLVFGVVGIDSEAGPTEVAIVADESATPAWLAADLISQAEHDELAQSILITHTKRLVTRVQEQVTRQLKDLKRSKIAKQSLSQRGAIVVTQNLEESITLANQYASEHLVLAVDNPDVLVKQVTNAGAIFLGHYTPVAVGDYLAGPNHVLPTGGTARFFSPLGVDDFLKRTSFMRFEPPKLRELGADVIRLAEVEGLTGHGVSVDLRLQKIRRARREREAAREAEL
jgi:histidinol dehydrogenase